MLPGEWGETRVRFRTGHTSWWTLLGSPARLLLSVELAVLCFGAWGSGGLHPGVLAARRAFLVMGLEGGAGVTVLSDLPSFGTCASWAPDPRTGLGNRGLCKSLSALGFCIP